MEELPRANESVKELMTPEELELFRDVERWKNHSITAYVERGAAFLDRIMPGWESRVEVNKLDLKDTCRCVLGQLWAEKSTMREGGYVSGFSAARDMMCFEALDTQWNSEYFTPEEFFGFDTSDNHEFSHSDLTQEWTALLEARSG